MSKSVKESVLAKCGEARNGKIQWVKHLNSELPLQVFEDTRGRLYYQIGGVLHVVTLQFREDTHEDSLVWPLAAQILGIEERKITPSRDLLRKAFGKGYSSYLAPLDEAETIFEEWLAENGIEDDQAKKDRNDLLWECWLAACAGDYPSGEEKERDYFNEWLAEVEVENG